MMGPRSLHILSILLLLLSTFSAAWPWPRWLPEADALVVRQDSKGDSNKATVTPSETSQTQKQKSSSSSQNSQSDSQTESPTESSTDTKSKSPSVSTSLEVETIVSAGKTKTTTLTHLITAPPATGTGTKGSSSTSHKTFDSALPAGAISLVSPDIVLGSQFYKVGDNVTFEFAYTNVLETPTAVNVLATCTANNHMYTMAMDHKVGNSTGTVVWDTGKYQATGVTKLFTETYTLIIYDAASNISATAEPGYLAVFNQYAFGMYLPQHYEPLNTWQCATCSGALGDMERMALTTVLSVGIITLLSFTWFVGGLGITL